MFYNLQVLKRKVITLPVYNINVKEYKMEELKAIDLFEYILSDRL